MMSSSELIGEDLLELFDLSLQGLILLEPLLVGGVGDRHAEHAHGDDSEVPGADLE